MTTLADPRRLRTDSGPAGCRPRGGASSRQSGSSWRASLTAWPTARRAVRASGSGASSSCSSGAGVAWSSHASSAAWSGSITGIRSWMSRRRSLASVVMIVQVRSVSSPSPCQMAQSPANANGAPSARVMWNGCLRGLPGRGCHS